MFSEYLRKHRKEAKLSQKELAERMTSLGYKVSHGLISYYETDYGREKKGWTNRPPEPFISALAKSLGLNEAEVRLEAGYAVKIATSQFNPEINALLEKLRTKIASQPEDEKSKIETEFKTLLLFLDSKT